MFKEGTKIECINGEWYGAEFIITRSSKRYVYFKGCGISGAVPKVIFFNEFRLLEG